MSSITSAQDYVTDVAYPAYFHRETMPSWLCATMTALGRQAPDLAAPFVWIDVGCGAGLSALVAAASHPLGQFIGIDISQREIEQASRIAAAAGLQNVRFIGRDIQDVLCEGDLAQADFIVAHGIYSWVSDATRAAIHALVQQHLKPGGIAYVSYTSQPGAAAFAAAQKLLRLLSLQTTGTSDQKLSEGVGVLQRLAQGGAGYFAAHPTARRYVAEMAHMDRMYLAHEYLNAHWQAFHVADVMRLMAECGCEYAGSASLLDNIDAVSLPSGVQAEIAAMQRQGASLEALETLRDIARNQGLRRDLYQKSLVGGSVVLSESQHRRKLLEQKFSLIPRADAMIGVSSEVVIPSAIGPVTLSSAAVKPLLNRLAQSNASFADLAALAEYRQNPSLLNPLLQVLMAAGYLHIVPSIDSAVVSLRDRAMINLQSALDNENIPSLKLLKDEATAISKRDF